MSCVEIQKKIAVNKNWNNLESETLNIYQFYIPMNTLNLSKIDMKIMFLSFSQYDSNGKVFYDLYIFNQPFCANACQFQSDTTLSAAAWIFPISI